MTTVNNTTSTIILAFIAGSAVGVAAGLLMAPQSGEESRNRIKQKAQETVDKTKDKVSHGKDVVQDKVQDATDNARVVADETKRSVRQSRNRVDEQIS